MSAVPVLLTCDIHTHGYAPELVDDDLTAARTALRAAGLRATFLFPARAAAALAAQLAPLRAEGHEIGCHGLTHAADENFRTLPAARQRAILAEATAQIEALAGVRPVSFRAPAYRLGPATIAALEALDYRADLSVTSQRLGVFGGDPYHLGPLFARRRPYHPSPDAPYRAGATRLWELPVSACVLPFVSNTGRVFGERFMRVFFRALHAEARATGKPIVFVFHVEDLSPDRPADRRPRLSWRHFVPSPAYGLQVREFLVEHDWARVAAQTRALLATMARAPGVEVLTASEYCDRLDARSVVPAGNVC
ncbi:MAG TPA: polysaccharide deacetylase family protein [Terriglobales bacterium]|nr:polysaccharide deacetylase family protein [Terriglobales bacterium]